MAKGNVGLLRDDGSISRIFSPENINNLGFLSGTRNVFVDLSYPICFCQLLVKQNKNN